MSTINVFCLATEKESKECTDLFINFKSNLQAQTSHNTSIKVHDVRSVSKLKGNDKLCIKLENKLNTVHAIFVICSPCLKSYLDEGSPSRNDLLKGDERKVLLKCLVKQKSKVVMVYLDEKFVNDIPQVLKGYDLVHGLEDLREIVDVKLPALFSTGS